MSKLAFSVLGYNILGLKVFTDAHSTVTAEEGDRYPLGPPSFTELVGQERKLCILDSHSGPTLLATQIFAANDFC
jgi:hypothetical protein